MSALLGGDHTSSRKVLEEMVWDRISSIGVEIELEAKDLSF